MKKLFALFLVMALLLPTLVGSSLAAADLQKDATNPSNDKVTAKPFHIVSWSAIDETLSDFDNANELYTVNCSVKDDKVLISRGGGVGSDPDKVAADMKKEMDARPEGQRYLHVWAPAKAFRMAPEAVIYLDKGVDALKETFTTLITTYHALGGKLDGLVIDLEYIGLSTYYISDDFEKDFNLFNKIVNHPNYATEVRPLLVERGFTFWPDYNDVSTEIFGVYDKSSTKPEFQVARSIWNKVMRIRLGQYLNESLCEPFLKLYPDCYVGDYQSTDMYSWVKSPDEGYAGGNSAKAGNSSNYNTYSSRPGADYFKENGKYTYQHPVGYNDAGYADTPYHMFMWDANLFKNMYASTDNQNISAWIAEYDYNSKRAGSVSNTPYYTETILHIGMLDPKPFLLYMYRPSFESDEAYYSRIGVISEILAELTRLVGTSDRKPIHIPANWNNDYVLSGMYAGGRNVWRITPSTEIGVSLEDFQVYGTNDPTFHISGKTITFPQGKIIADSKISVVGTCGYWVETPADIVPIITTDPDRFSKYPSYLESYESYEAGTIYTYTSFANPDAWEITESTRNTSTIVIDPKDATNKVLSVSGSATLTSVIIPKNITAGDSYAKEQTWELTFTLPETVDANAELVLLSFTGSGLEKPDGGIKIAGGKVYYDQNGEYVEMKKAAVTAGGTYTVKRVMNFTGEKTVTNEDGTTSTIPAYTCDYYIYDAEGTVLGIAKNISIGGFTLPANTISFGCANFTSAVLFDNFKLYPSGVAGDFAVYDAKTGMIAADVTAARSTDTAYRYSWMNASDKVQTASIIAAYYDKDNKLVSEEVVQTLYLKPGCDGVETGIVSAKDQNVVIYVKTASASNFNSTRLLLIMTGAVAFAALGALAGGLLLQKKKRSA